MKLPNYMHIDEAKKNGYIIDSHASGRPIAYRGERFATTELHECFTPLESALVQLLDKFDRESARSDKTTQDAAYELLEEMNALVIPLYL